MSQHPEINEAVLVGVPDGKWGERIHLAYTGRPGLNVDDIRKFLNSRVASWKIPKGVGHCHVLPRRGGFKPDYGRIVELAGESSH